MNNVLYKNYLLSVTAELEIADELDILTVNLLVFNAKFSCALFIHVEIPLFVADLLLTRTWQYDREFSTKLADNGFGLNGFSCDNFHVHLHFLW